MRQLSFLGLLFLFISCNHHENNYPIIINYGDKAARAEFDSLKLDSVYVNLLTTAKTEAEGDTLYQRWVTFHKELNARIKNDNFNWDTKDSSVIIWDRVYCKPDGEIKYYVYNIVDTIITQERKVAFGKLVKSLNPPLKYNVELSEQYAQCGTYRHHIY